MAGMSGMLSKRATKYFGCCAHCARGRNHNAKPQRMARRQARAVEKRDTRTWYSEYGEGFTLEPLYPGM